MRIYGKLENNFHLANKKALFINMKMYYETIGVDPFSVIPVTFHIKEGLYDASFKQFKRTYDQLALDSTIKNVWIVKPGENSNQGRGIEVCRNLSEVESIISNYAPKQTYII